jgi:hypothetical protein
MVLTKDETKDVFYHDLIPLFILFLLSLIWAVKSQNGLFDFYKIGYANEIEITKERGDINNIRNHKYFVLIAMLVFTFISLFYLTPVIIMIFYDDVYSKSNQIVLKILSYLGLAILLISWVAMLFISPLLATRSIVAFGAALGIIYIVMTNFIDSTFVEPVEYVLKTIDNI